MDIQKKTSFDSEEFNSDIEEDEIETKSQTKNKEDESTKLPNLNLIKAISQTLTSILENNKKLPNFKEILKNQGKMVFSANLIPDISIEEYLIRIQTYANMERSTLILSLILIDRLCQKSNLTLTYHNIHRIIFSSILISIKYNEDNYYDNKYYAEIAGVKIKELKLLEYNFISLLHFNLFIKDDIYEKYKQYLLEFECEQEKK
jgi:hypothetical protein